ncbi:exopolyphosphatase/guanosine-5'-triphosphate,3'-diphosphate pyrophosphatase [Aeromicrobium panaciterrae]|uniref:Exopolyphosphatase/guanosine-5'-triphosphate, 3'-diphosphate pyrophosphatase n=1 Tax=Aeromicrobium panaciterrae TaxID=363861 RepID=A0ABU1ULP3_9ACTN|nr:Ppx/GppA phosphatase family protein [Aeromicrobium panaciterrae]MDR7086108.1 exopolyphosphatase/guanosine-5'-triphosphate,3'-diphosphate pyrophosphatase [Aeromicrobium panaciterrae]
MTEPRVRVAAFDCGTNSIRLLICDLQGDTKTDHLREMKIVRLGQDVDRTGRLADEAIGRTLSATRDFAELIPLLGVERIVFCATSAVRDAENGEAFCDAVEGILGVRPIVLDGAAEARATFLGATRELPPKRSLVVDIGGGSTEVVIGAGSELESGVSLDIGSVRLTERFLRNDPPTLDEMAECIAYVDSLIAPIATFAPVERFVGVAGTITTVVAHALNLDAYDSGVIHGAELTHDMLRKACHELTGMSVADRRELPFMHPGRADVIGGGALILHRILELLPFDTETMVASEQDILDGIAWMAVEPPLG